MEFTQLVKKGSACLFLVLVAHGLLLGFSVSTTVLSVVLAVIVFKMESELVLSERKEFLKKLEEIRLDYEKKLAVSSADFEQQVIKLSEQSKLEKEQLKEHLENIKSQINGIKMNHIIRK